MSSRLRRWVVWGATAGVAVLLALVAVAWYGVRSDILRDRIVSALSEQFGSDVTMERFTVSAFPRLRIDGEGLTLRHRRRTDVPPLITIRRFSAEGGVAGLLRRSRRVDTVTVEGLTITIPSGGVGARAAQAPAAAGKSPAPDGAASAHAEASVPGEEADPRAPGESPVVIERLHSRDARLVLLPGKPGKRPRVFDIHTLTIASLGLGRRVPFEAVLTNPVPTGRIETTGSLGPWVPSEPGATPVSGQYRFADADLSTIKGIGGTLTSTGAFDGRLNRIDVKGTTEMSDFRLSIGAHALPLATRFHAIVDGTDGDTHLEEVDATLGETHILARGAVVGREGEDGRTVQLDVEIDRGRLEDVLRLSMKSAAPFMTGALRLTTTFLLPPGDADVSDRLRLDGRFTVDDADFTDPEVDQKLTGMSRRAQGRPDDTRIRSVQSDFGGRFRMADGRIAFPSLTFDIPGATVSLAGAYGVRSEAIVFDGTLRMQATISQAAGGGVKGFLLKAVDPLFRRKGAGAVVPIRIRGSREKPEFGVDMKRAILRK